MIGATVPAFQFINVLPLPAKTPDTCSQSLTTRMPTPSSPAPVAGRQTHDAQAQYSARLRPGLPYLQETRILQQSIVTDANRERRSAGRMPSPQQKHFRTVLPSKDAERCRHSGTTLAFGREQAIIA